MMGEPIGFIARMNTTQISIPGVTVLEQLVNASLAEQTADKRLQPQLADAVPSIENGLWRLLPDGRMETTWRIREDARWHDGTPLTSDDLTFTIAVDQDKDMPIFRPSGYAWIERADAVDARTVRVTWSQPYIGADTLFTQGFGSPLPRHLLSEAFAGDKSRFLAHPYWAQEFVGTGPFLVREWLPGAFIVLRANDAYALGRPKLDEIEVRFVLDLNTLMTNLISGTVELTLGRGFTVESALQLRDQWREGRMELDDASWVVVMPQFVNPNPAVVAEPDFRRALLHATDRQQLVDSLQGGLSSIAHQYISSSYAEHREVDGSVVKYDYDPRRAAQLIERLGYTRGVDGVYRDASGERLTLELRSNGERITENAIIPVAAFWMSVGVATEPNVVPQQRIADREYMAVFPGFRMMRQPDDPEAISRFHSNQTPLPDSRFVGRNYSRYMNPDFDAMIDRYFSTIPPGERMQILRQLVRHMSENATVLGMFYDADISFMNSRLRNLGVRQSNLWNVHLWDLSS
jgi:peptide/nickel transport system substrate-binding protein